MPHMRYVLVGDGESPHLLKWAQTLAPQVELWVASSRGFLPEFITLLPQHRRLALGAKLEHRGGNLGLLLKLSALGRWLQQVDADWINPHYLTSHGTLVWAARSGWKLRGRLVGSAWGSDILVTPRRHGVYRWLTRQVLQACVITTSDSQHMARQMHELGAHEVMVFPFGLEQLPPPSPSKRPWLFYANRGLEPLYRPQRVLEAFAAIAAVQPDARLVVANDGSLRETLQAWVQIRGLAERVQFVGRLTGDEQDRWYTRAQWFLSLPESDSVAVSVLEAMGHGCIPLLSDLPANRELVKSGHNGLIVLEKVLPDITALQALAAQAKMIASNNRAWIQAHGLFAPAVARLLARLHEIEANT